MQVALNNWLLCHIVHFEFTEWVKIQNLQYDNHIVNFVFTPTQ